MPGVMFRTDVESETGLSWERWVKLLEENCGPAPTYDQLAEYLQERGVGPEWVPIIADMYGERLGRKPVGQTMDVGFNVGIRRTAAIPKEEAWHHLVSPSGLKLWIGDVEPFPLQVGSVFQSKDGVSGKLGVVKPYEKLRMSWRRREWDNPSTLQITLLATKTGKTTFAFHQEKLEDVYMRYVMKRHWEKVVDRLIETAVRHIR